MSGTPSPPEKVGPYRIERLLGSGGMGEVYRAFDPRLDRRVAIKHIRPDVARQPGYRQRLEREAKTVASLDHPSVVQIFDVLRTDDGGEWIVMELVDGPTVHRMVGSGPLEIGVAVGIALDVIDGLAQAHSKGILHRDLKSENIMVAPSGAGKILDFGLAKRMLNVEDVTVSVDGALLGTCRAMAPEQAHGHELDQRADLFSFGVLLYEMLTGKSPFESVTPMATLVKVCSHPHVPAISHNEEVPEALSELVDRLLEKEREDRPQSAREVAQILSEIADDLPKDVSRTSRPRHLSRSWHSIGEETTWLDAVLPGDTRLGGVLSSAFGLRLAPVPRLGVWVLWLAVLFGASWWLLRPPPPDPDAFEPTDARVVVLPFDNQGPDEMAHVAAGLTDELIRELTGRRGLAVVSYKTATQYGDGDKSLQKIGEELDIGYVLEGSVASGMVLDSDARLRISLRLIRVEDGQVLLSRSIDRVASDTLRMQSEIADEVSRELGAQILADSHRELSADPVALDAYFRGLTYWHATGYSFDHLTQAESYFREAVREDPEFVLAWVELTRVRSMVYFNWNPSAEVRRGAEEAERNARQLAPDSIAVMLASGYFRYHVEGDLSLAQSEFERAVKKAPNHPDALEAVGYVMRRKGKLDEAVVHLERAFDLDRGNAALAGFLAETERARRSYDAAERWFGVALQRGSEQPYVVGERAENTMARLGCGDLGDPLRCPVGEALRILDESDLKDDPSLWGYRVRLAIYQLDDPASFEEFLELYDSVEPAEIEPGERYRLAWRKALLLRALGREDEAVSLAAQCSEDLRQLSAESDYYMHRALLSLYLVIQGEGDLATRTMGEALKTATADPFSGPRVEQWAAVVFLLAGDQESALGFLDAASEKDYQLSLASYELKGDSLWKPLRGTEGFELLWRSLREREQRHSG